MFALTASDARRCRRAALTTLFSCMTLAAAGTAATAATHGEPYPSHPIRVIVDGPAGSIGDIYARRFAKRMSESMGQPITVDNRPGASGTIAAEAVSRAAPDGYTLLYGGMNPLIAFPGAGGQVRYDPANDFIPVAISGVGYPMLVANAELGVKTVEELGRLARASAQPLNCATVGHASVQHFGCLSLGRMLNAQIRTVTYKGGAPALLDMANGSIQVGFAYVSELEPHTTSGRIVALAALSPERVGRYPDAPTLAEAGYPPMRLAAFTGFYAPKGTPTAIVERLNAESIKAMQEPEMQALLKLAGGTYRPLSPSAFAELVRETQATWREMSDQFGVKIEP